MIADIRHPKPEALLRIPAEGPALVEGTAGTGKTHVLGQLVVDLIVERGLDLSEILVLTFSSEAAAAMKREVHAALGTLLAMRETSTKLSAEQCWVIDDEVRERLRRSLRSFDRARVATVPDWANATVEENAFLVHRPFERQRVDERMIFSSALRDVLREGEYDSFLAAWLDVKRSSYRELEDLLFRSSKLNGRLTPPFDGNAILRAARAVPDREVLEAAMADVVPRSDLDRVRRSLDGLSAALGCEDPALLLARLEGVDLSYLGEKLPELRDLEIEVVSLAAAAVDVLVPLTILRMKQLMREGRRECGDAAARVLLATLESERGPELMRILARRHRAVLVDELQELDELRWVLLEKAFLDPAGQRLLYAFCDPRGAVRGDLAVLRRARTAVAGKGAVVPLGESFRATPELVEGLNLIFEQALEQPFFSGWPGYDLPLRAVRTTTRLSRVDLAPAAPVILLRSEGDHARRVLAGGIADEVRAITSDPDRQLLFGERGNDARLRLRDVLVLTATAAEAEEIGKALEARAVAYSLYRCEGLFQSRAAQDVLALLAAIEAPTDRSACVRAFLTPFFGLSLRDLHRAQERGEWDALSSRLETWKAQAEGRDTARLFERVLEESGLLLRARLSSESERTAARIVQIFQNLAAAPETAQATLSELEEAVETRRGAAGAERPDGAGDDDANVFRFDAEDAVRISTLAASRGLEAPVVFLYAFSGATVDGVHLFHDADRRPSTFVGDRRRAPSHVRAAVEAEESETNQRLLYLGLTRARARLYLPLVPDVLAKRGVYAPLHERLLDLAGIFPIQPISNGWPAAPRSNAYPVEPWQPPGSLLEDLGDAVATAVPTFAATSSLVEPAEEACLREILVTVPLVDVGNGVERVVLHALRAGGVDRRRRGEIEQLTHVALTTPLPLAEGRLEGGLSSVRSIRRNVSYVLVAPDGEDGEGRPVGGRLDVLFEHEGLAYVGGFRRRAAPATEQSILGALSLLRISSEEDYLARFGGFHSFSLAAMPSGGVVLLRPAWQELQEFRDELFRETET